MKKGLTEIIYVLDRSGSMGHLTGDTIGAYNAYLREQKSFDGETKITTVLFDDKYELLFNGVSVDEAFLDHEKYFVRGMTALYDALGKTIIDVGRRLASTPESERPEKVIFIITTDGYENASREFTQSKVREMIEHQQSKYNWEFLFFGANIDSAETASSIGVCPDAAYDFEASTEGISDMIGCCMKATSVIRNKK
ncbi:MAG: VWA domain-containing protein [Eubacterium sp.]|nr:VWA domain-containing protein [Eubacterium sp.]